MEPRWRWLVLGTCVACSSPSATGVPVLDPDALSSPTFAGLRPRAFSLRVVDVRTPLPETSAPTVAELERALGARLRQSGFDVKPVAPNELSFSIDYKSEPLPGYEREDCVWITARIETPNARAEAEGGGCFEVRNLYGMDLGGDASTAYQSSLNVVLELLDRSWARVNPSKTASFSAR